MNVHVQVNMVHSASSLALLVSLANLSLPEQTAVGATGLRNTPAKAGQFQCVTGCLACSKWNGCTACSHNYTWHLERLFMRKVGICLRECPPGYFRQPFSRAKDLYRCASCEVKDCELCSNSMYCEKCNRPYLEYRGKCRLTCPPNLYHSHYNKDCLQQVDCVMHSWSSWTQCLRSGKSCGYKWGNRTRYREVVQEPSPSGKACPLTNQTERCKLEERYCNFAQRGWGGSVRIQRLQRRSERRRRRCRLQEKAGRSCKSSYNYIGNIVSTPSPSQAETPDVNSPSYYNYYRQSAQLLQLLNLKKSRNFYHLLKVDDSNNYEAGLL